MDGSIVGLLEDSLGADPSGDAPWGKATARERLRVRESIPLYRRPMLEGRCSCSSRFLILRPLLLVYPTEAETARGERRRTMRAGSVFMVLGYSSQVCSSENYGKIGEGSCCGKKRLSNTLVHVYVHLLVGDTISLKLAHHRRCRGETGIKPEK